MILASNLERLIASGGNVSIDGSKYIQRNLERFAAFAANSGATLTIRNSQRILQINLERLAAFGKGRVVFIFDEV
jgi:hypothetical protein